MGKAEISGIVVFKVSLRDSKKPWRRIAIRGEQTLDHLHRAIFAAFDREEDHLYFFYFPKPGSKRTNLMFDSTEYACPYNCEDPGPFQDESLLNAAKSPLSGLNLAPGQTFFYLFDFGDEWWHGVVVEQIDTASDDGKYPRVIEKHGKSPAQYPE